MSQKTRIRYFCHTENGNPLSCCPGCPTVPNVVCTWKARGYDPPNRKPDSGAAALARLHALIGDKTNETFAKRFERPCNHALGGCDPIPEHRQHGEVFSLAVQSESLRRALASVRGLLSLRANSCAATASRKAPWENPL